MEPYHYTLIKRAIDLIDTAPGPLSLTELAGQMQMSPTHFQRVFTQWAGVSPKRYHQYLTLGLAKELLARGLPLMAAANQAGLSGTGRLHDLFVTWDAMTPGSYAAQGDGMTIRWAETDTVYGPAIGMATDRGLCALGFAAQIGTQSTYDDLAGRWPKAQFARSDDVAPMVHDAIDGRGRLHVRGGPFQIKVWEALLNVPDGGVTTYGDIARDIGQPGAARAVGTAVGQNPISCAIPCHTVLRKSGELGGYHWGTGIKRAMLARETARFDAK